MRHVAGDAIVILCQPYFFLFGAMYLVGSTVAGATGIKVLCARRELDTKMRIMTGNATHP
jgi:hypothetical protein